MDIQKLKDWWLELSSAHDFSNVFDLLPKEHNYMVPLSGGCDCTSIILAMHFAGYGVTAYHCNIEYNESIGDHLNILAVTPVLEQLGIRVINAKNDGEDTHKHAMDYGQDAWGSVVHLIYENMLSEYPGYHYVHGCVSSDDDIGNLYQLSKNLNLNFSELTAFAMLNRTATTDLRNKIRHVDPALNSYYCDHGRRAWHLFNNYSVSSHCSAVKAAVCPKCRNRGLELITSKNFNLDEFLSFGDESDHLLAYRLDTYIAIYIESRPYPIWGGVCKDPELLEQFQKQNKIKWLYHTSDYVVPVVMQINKEIVARNLSLIALRNTPDVYICTLYNYAAAPDKEIFKFKGIDNATIHDTAGTMEISKS